MNEHKEPKKFDAIKSCKIILLANNRFYLRKYTKLLNTFNILKDYTPFADPEFDKAYWDLQDFYDLVAHYKPIREVIDDVALSLNSSKRGKTRRLKQRITRIMANGPAFLLTLTFRPDVLNSTNRETRHKYITRLLKDYCTDYVANIDYGSLRGREHYHAVCNTDYDLQHFFVYGWVTLKPIGTTHDDIVKVSRYVAKLSMHAVKETTIDGEKLPNLIYSRTNKSDVILSKCVTI